MMCAGNQGGERIWVAGSEWQGAGTLQFWDMFPVLLVVPISVRHALGMKVCMNLSSFPSNKVTKTSGLRPMEPKDVKAVRELINSYLKQFHLAPVMDEEEVAHWFLPREHIIDTFVVEVKIRR